jgi:hypothetical protein
VDPPTPLGGEGVGGNGGESEVGCGSDQRQVGTAAAKTLWSAASVNFFTNWIQRMRYHHKLLNNQTVQKTYWLYILGVTIVMQKNHVRSRSDVFSILSLVTVYKDSSSVVQYTVQNNTAHVIIYVLFPKHTHLMSQI